MENIVTYLLYRHDITFKQKEFNEVDALVLSLLSYITWQEIGIKQDARISLVGACQKYQDYFKKAGDKDTYIFAQRILDVLDKVKHARRYEDVVLSNYVVYDDENTLTQFAAMTFELDSNTKFIAFRGTDRSILGWKENVKMLHSATIESHQYATNYLESIQKTKGMFKQTILYVAGHSKGGHLAMASAINASSCHPYIKQVYCFDGPGFLSEFYQGKSLNTIIDKITNFVPECSVFGRMLEHREKMKIVHGYDQGLRQHDATSWKCLVDSFDYCKVFSNESDELLGQFNQLVMEKDITTRKRMMDSLCLWIDTMDMKTLSDVKTLNFDKMFQGVLGLTSLQPDERRFMFHLATVLVEQANNIFLVKK